MTGKTNSAIIIKRIMLLSIYIEGGLTVLIYFFTRNLFFCAVTMVSTLMSVSGFWLMIVIVDKMLKNQKAVGLFFFAGVGKLTIISVCFYLISRVSEQAIIFYILGLSAVVISILFEGGLRLIKGLIRG